MEPLCSAMFRIHNRGIHLRTEWCMNEFGNARVRILLTKNCKALSLRSAFEYADGFGFFPPLLALTFSRLPRKMQISSLMSETFIKSRGTSTLLKSTLKLFHKLIELTELRNLYFLALFQMARGWQSTSNQQLESAAKS